MDRMVGLPKGYAVVEFADKLDAERAKDFMDGGQARQLAGSCLALPLPCLHPMPSVLHGGDVVSGHCVEASSPDWVQCGVCVWGGGTPDRASHALPACLPAALQIDGNVVTVMDVHQPRKRPEVQLRRPSPPRDARRRSRSPVRAARSPPPRDRCGDAQQAAAAPGAAGRRALPGPCQPPAAHLVAAVLAPATLGGVSHGGGYIRASHPLQGPQRPPTRPLAPAAPAIPAPAPALPAQRPLPQPPTRRRGRPQPAPRRRPGHALPQPPTRRRQEPPQGRPQPAQGRQEVRS